jgi:hypothetical protein
MAPGPTHRRWLIVGPTLLVVGVMATVVAGFFLEPRRAAAFFFYPFVAATLISFFAVAVVLLEQWPANRSWSRLDAVCLLLGCIPLALVVAAIIVVVMDVGG